MRCSSNGPVKQTGVSDDDGRCQLSWDKDLPINRVTVTVSRKGYVPVKRDWLGNQRAVDLPEQVKIELVKGNQLSGIVLDEAGGPVVDATVKILLSVQSSKMSSQYFSAANVQTDEQGKWTWDGFPLNNQRTRLYVSHPKYMRQSSRFDSVDVENEVTLKQGLTITGRIVDADGKPIEKASASFGTGKLSTSLPTALTDADGQFEIAQCEPGPSAVTVKAKSYAPQLQKIVASADMIPLKFQLQPGNKVHIKIVDSDGESVKDARLSSGDWLEFETLKLSTNTDATGEFVWEDAPLEPVEFTIRKSGYMTKRAVSIAPSDEAQIVTLDPKLLIVGAVRGEESGEPVDSFQLVSGYKFRESGKIYWSRSPPVEQKNGRYEFAFERPQKMYYLKVIASGYEPSVSRAFEPDEGLVEYDFSLRDGFSIKGALRMADGTTVPKAKIAYVPPETNFRIKNGLIDLQENGVVVETTDRTGRFTITPTGKKNAAFILLASTEEGFATYKFSAGGGERFNPKEILNLKLEPWGKLEGTVFAKGQPAANQQLEFWATDFYRRCKPFPISMSFSTKSDADGKFKFARLPPGKGSVAKMVNKNLYLSGRSMARSTPCWQTPVTIIAEETASIDVAKSGIVVKGSVTTDKEPDFEIDWTLNHNAKIKRSFPRMSFKNGRAAIERYYHFEAEGAIDRDGSFEIPNVPPGSYELTVKLSPNNQPEFIKGNEVGESTIKFTVKKDQAEPLDLGNVVIKILGGT